jgi:hypothetical protein
VIDPRPGTLDGNVDLIASASEAKPRDGESASLRGDASPEEGTRILAQRPPRSDLAADPDLPADTRLWAALQSAGGGIWGGCVYDAQAIAERLR